MTNSMYGVWREIVEARFLSRYPDPAYITRHIFNQHVTVGHTAIENPDPKNMGTIAYADLDVSVLAPDAATAFATWSFEHEGTRVAGVFTLVFRLLEGKWRIVHDHSTAFPDG